LKSLKDMHIKAINLNYEYVNQSTGTEALIGNVATFIYEDDTIGDIGEMWVSSDLYDAIEKVIVGVTDMTDGLPNVRSYGKVNSLHAAIALDETGRLKELVEDFVSETDNDTRLAIVEDILHLICHTEDVEDGSRGSYVNAKNLAVIEALMGNGFMGVNGENPNSAAAPILNRVYNNLVELYCFAMIGSQITEHLNYIRADVDEDGNRNPYMGFFNRHMLYDLELGYISEKTFSDACSYLGYYGSNIENDYRLFTEFRTYIEANAPQYLGIVDTSVFGAIRDSDSGNYINGTTIADVIYGNGGNDTINGGDGNDLLFGGDGNDAIYGGKGNDTIYGDDGDDLLDGGVGDDILKGGSGNDTYVFAKGYGSDTIIDADGLNTLRFKGLNPTDILVNGTGDSDVTITIKGTNDTLVIKDFRKGEEYANYDLEFDGVKMHVTDKGSPFRHIFGGNGDDVLKAVVDDSIMHAFGGNDTVYGSDGNDVIYGNEGNDAIYAGIGDDIVYGGDGNDILDGGKGSDFLYGGSDNDTYVFGRNYGTDIISDSEGVSTIKIADGISLDELDIISVGEDIVISLSDSEDKLIINGFAENPDNYILEVGGERTSLKDRVSAVNDEFLSGSDESDYIVNENSSIVAGGSGDDRIIGNDGDEIIFGDSGNDQILSDSGNDVIFGGSGDDYINGGDGNDMIDGGSGNDFIDGGTGDDIYFFNPGYGNDSIKDSDGANTIMFGDGFTASGIKAYRSNWNDLLITFDGFEDTLTIKDYCINENARNFTLVFADGTVVEAAAKDSPLRKIYGTDGSEYMESIYDDGIINDAQASDDQIVGSDGNDTLYGGDGDERITGKAGDDILDGGKGNDYLNGGAGNDTYIFNKGYGVDTISDGEGTNTININGYSANQIKAYRTNWNDITITFADSEDKIIIEGFFTSEANRNFYLTFNGGGRVHATASNSPLRTIYGTDGDEYIAAMDDRGVTLYGEGGADNLNGGGGADRLYGGIGNDQLYGNSGNDTLDGGEGDDMLYGGAGNDTYIFNVGSGTDTIIDSEGINTILFGTGLTEDAMTAYKHNWNDLMITFEGVEDKLIIQGYFGSESNRNFEVRFADGTRYAYDDAENPIKQVHATEYDDWMTAWSDNGIALHGDGGNDNLTGGAGDDMLFGGIGNDTLNGNDGDDILDGGEGSDFLYGGLGNDTYRFGIGYGSDIIEDNDGDNKVEILGISSDTVSFEMTDGGELVITITESGDVLTIRNFDSERFTFEFTDEVSGTFNVETGEFERILSEEELAAIEAAKTEDELAQANADILDELYADDNSVSELLTENDNTVISEIADSVSTADENENTADQIDVQVMILTENMAAFLNESNISDSMNMQSSTDNSEFANQLLVSTQAS
jgi:Ca2+-binding RTX toxin-like protein